MEGLWSSGGLRGLAGEVELRMTRSFYGTGYSCHEKGCPWLWHVIRMGKAAVRKWQLLTDSCGHRRAERSKLRWLDCVTGDLANVGVRNHGRRAKDRTKWRKTIEETKPHSGLLSCWCLCVEDGCWSLLWNLEVHRWSQKSAVEVHMGQLSSVHTAQLIPRVCILLIVKNM